MSKIISILLVLFSFQESVSLFGQTIPLDSSLKSNTQILTPDSNLVESSYYGKWEIKDPDRLFLNTAAQDSIRKELALAEKPKEITFKILVRDTVSGETLKSNIYMTSINRTDGKRHKGAGITTESGGFEITVSPDSYFEINVNSLGFFTMNEVIDVRNETIKNGVIERTVGMRRLQKGDVVRLQNVNFAQNDYQLNQESIIQIERLIALLKANPKMVIKLEGHTETTSSTESSIKLSEKRVFEVRYFMIRKGIDVHRIKAEGYGNTKPIAFGKDEEVQKLNRRVEFRILKL